jgi:hypothetical protein
MRHTCDYAASGVVVNRDRFPNDEASTKLLYLALNNILSLWARPTWQWKAAIDTLLTFSQSAWPRLRESRNAKPTSHREFLTGLVRQSGFRTFIGTYSAARQFRCVFCRSFVNPSDEISIFTGAL